MKTYWNYKTHLHRNLNGRRMLKNLVHDRRSVIVIFPNLKNTYSVFVLSLILKCFLAFRPDFKPILWHSFFATTRNQRWLVTSYTDLPGVVLVQHSSCHLEICNTKQVKHEWTAFLEVLFLTRTNALKITPCANKLQGCFLIGTHLPAYLTTHLHVPTYLPTYLPTYPPTHLPTYPPNHLPT